MSPVAVTNFSFCSDSSIAGLKSDPLTVLVSFVLQDVASTVLSYDPLPPLDNISSYTRPNR